MAPSSQPGFQPSHGEGCLKTMGRNGLGLPRGSLPEGPLFSARGCLSGSAPLGSEHPLPGLPQWLQCNLSLFRGPGLTGARQG